MCVQKGHKDYYSDSMPNINFMKSLNEVGVTFTPSFLLVNFCMLPNAYRYDWIIKCKLTYIILVYITYIIDISYKDNQHSISCLFPLVWGVQ